MASAVSNPIFCKDKHTHIATSAPVEVPPELKKNLLHNKAMLILVIKTQKETLKRGKYFDDIYICIKICKTDILCDGVIMSFSIVCCHSN